MLARTCMFCKPVPQIRPGGQLLYKWLRGAQLQGCRNAASLGSSDSIFEELFFRLRCICRVHSLDTFCCSKLKSKQHDRITYK